MNTMAETCANCGHLKVNHEGTFGQCQIATVNSGGEVRMDGGRLVSSEGFTFCCCATFTPTQSKASEPAEAEEPKYIIERKPRNADPPYSHIPWERVPDTIGHDEEVVMGHALVVALNTGKLDATKYNYRIDQKTEVVSRYENGKNIVYSRPKEMI